MGRRFDSLARAIRRNGLGAQLVGGVLGSSGLKVVNLGVSITLTVFLARVLGPEGYGIYAFAFSLVTLLAIPVQVGLPILVVREVAKYHFQQRWGLMRGLLHWANRSVFVLSVGVGVAAALIAWVIFGQTAPIQLATFLWAVLLLPLIALGNLRGAALCGLHRVVQGQLPELLLRPGLHLFFAVVLALTSPLTPPCVMALHALAATLAFAVGVVLLLRALPIEIRTAAPCFDTRTWRSSLLPLSFLAGMQVINSQTDVVMLGLLTTNEEVGVYRAAVQGAQLVALPLTVVNLVLAPHISRLHAKGDRAALQWIATWSARLVLLAALPMVSIFVLSGSAILAMIFGDEYRPGYLALTILCIGQFVNSGMGSVGLLLNMTGHERQTAKGFAAAAIVNVTLNLMLIPIWGIEGAAVATATSLIIWNVLLCWQVWRKLGIMSTAIRFQYEG